MSLPGASEDLGLGGCAAPSVCMCKGPGLISAPRLWPGGQHSSPGDAGEGGATAESLVAHKCLGTGWRCLCEVGAWMPTQVSVIHVFYGATAGQWLDLVTLKVGVECTSMVLEDFSPAFPLRSRDANLIKH